MPDWRARPPCSHETFSHKKILLFRASLKQSLDNGINILKDHRLGFHCGVNAITLYQVAGCGYPIEQEWHERNPVPVREFGENTLEGGDIPSAIVGRQNHADQQDPDPSIQRLLNHGVQIALNPVDRVTAKSIVATKFQDQDVRLVNGQ